MRLRNSHSTIRNCRRRAALAHRGVCRDRLAPRHVPRRAPPRFRQIPRSVRPYVGREPRFSLFWCCVLRGACSTGRRRSRPPRLASGPLASAKLTHLALYALLIATPAAGITLRFAVGWRVADLWHRRNRLAMGQGPRLCHRGQGHPRDARERADDHRRVACRRRIGPPLILRDRTLTRMSPFLGR